jgi:hypothetical protein
MKKGVKKEISEKLVKQKAEKEAREQTYEIRDGVRRFKASQDAGPCPYFMYYPS